MTNGRDTILNSCRLILLSPNFIVTCHILLVLSYLLSSSRLIKRLDGPTPDLKLTVIRLIGHLTFFVIVNNHLSTVGVLIFFLVLKHYHIRPVLDLIVIHEHPIVRTLLVMKERRDTVQQLQVLSMTVVISLLLPLLNLVSVMKRKPKVLLRKVRLLKTLVTTERPLRN